MFLGIPVFIGNGLVGISCTGRLLGSGGFMDVPTIQGKSNYWCVLISASPTSHVCVVSESNIWRRVHVYKWRSKSQLVHQPT